MIGFVIDWTSFAHTERCWCGLKERRDLSVAHELVHLAIRRNRRMTGAWPDLRYRTVHRRNLVP